MIRAAISATANTTKTEIAMLMNARSLRRLGDRDSGLIVSMNLTFDEVVICFDLSYRTPFARPNHCSLSV